MDRFYWNYKTPGGFTDMVMYSDGTYLTGLVFEKTADGFTNRWWKEKPQSITDKESADSSKASEAAEPVHRLLPAFEDTVRWLDLYFGKDPMTGDFTEQSIWPDFTPAIKIEGLTPFRSKVIEIMRSIPYGQTMTYGEIAAEIGAPKMSAQAVGGAVGWNPICIIIPCHRVMGAGGKITGYGGGLDNKMALLKLEGITK